MSVFAFVLAIIVLGPLAKAIGARISRGGPAAVANSELRKTLQATEQRLADTENRLAAVEERLDFYEKLLANPETSRGPRSIQQ
ncbi:MAG TPA: hypothetical protein VK864_10680 [Longimicrobiales bacterium]|nr:hypothetical protein [Longimicrobiales bacterium]